MNFKHKWYQEVRITGPMDERGEAMKEDVTSAEDYESELD